MRLPATPTSHQIHTNTRTPSPTTGRYTPTPPPLTHMESTAKKCLKWLKILPINSLRRKRCDQGWYYFHHLPPLTTTRSSLVPRPSPRFPSLTAQLSRTVLQVTKSWARAWEPGYTLSTGVDIEGIFIRYEYWLHHCVQNCCFASIKSGSYRGNRYSSIDMCMWAPPLMKFNDTVLRDCFIIWLTNRSYSLVLSASRASKSDVEL